MNARNINPIKQNAESGPYCPDCNRPTGMPELRRFKGQCAACYSNQDEKGSYLWGFVAITLWLAILLFMATPGAVIWFFRHPRPEKLPMTTNIISKTPESDRDCWRTPPEVFRWLDRRFNFDIDLAASDENTMVKPIQLANGSIIRRHFAIENDSLKLPWHKFARTAFCNPPYSDIDPWLKKAEVEAGLGLTTAFVIPAPNGEDRYGESVFGVASEMIFITGRIAFLRPDGTPVPGNTRGSCVVIYEAHNVGNGVTAMRHVHRDWIMETFK